MKIIKMYIFIIIILILNFILFDLQQNKLINLLFPIILGLAFLLNYKVEKSGEKKNYFDIILILFILHIVICMYCILIFKEDIYTIIIWFITFIINMIYLIKYIKIKSSN
ncbi:hypothetical protein B5G15_04465 [Faecalitalea cylindroides]|nr:hypothetical protein B5G15_04465 [Faecalitalea cylindroides]